MNKKIKKISAIVGGAILIAGISGISGALMFPKTITNDVIVEKNITQEVIKEVPVEVIKEVNITKEVFVDNGKLELVLKHIYDNDGSVEYLTEDLDDDELSLIVSRVVLINDFKSLAIEAIKKDLFDELDGVNVNGTILDDRDMEKLKIDSEDNEVIIEDIDFEDLDAEVKVTGSFKQDDVKYNFEALVSFKDGEYDELEDIEVTLA